MEKPTRVRILDHEYLVRSDEDGQQVQKIAQFVDNKFKEVMDNTEGLSERKIAILAAFHIASEFFQVIKERDDLVDDIQKRARAVNYQIDSAVR